jgi:hypothetical protein
MKKIPPGKLLLLIKFVFPAILFASALSARAEQFKFAFKSGTSYDYVLSSTHSSSAKALESGFASSPEVKTQKFQLSVIDFQEGAFIVDLKTSGQVLRRYIRENGEIAGAPAEAGRQVPFFISLPEGDWQPGQRHQISRPIRIGTQSFSSSWQLLFKSINKETGMAEILFACSPALPATKLGKRKYSLRGRINFDLGQGLISSADWVSEYRFSLQNKEMAVTRNIWNVEEKISYNLKLENGGK